MKKPKSKRVATFPSRRLVGTVNTGYPYYTGTATLAPNPLTKAEIAALERRRACEERIALAREFALELSHAGYGGASCAELAFAHADFFLSRAKAEREKAGKA